MVRSLNPPTYSNEPELSLEFEHEVRTVSWEEDNVTHELNYTMRFPVVRYISKEQAKKNKTLRSRHQASRGAASDGIPVDPNPLIPPPHCKIASVGKGNRRGLLIFSEKRPVCSCDFFQCRRFSDSLQSEEILRGEMARFFGPGSDSTTTMDPEYTVSGSIPRFPIPISAIQLPRMR
jgi:hypothetical protein